MVTFLFRDMSWGLRNPCFTKILWSIFCKWHVQSIYIIKQHCFIDVKWVLCCCFKKGSSSIDVRFVPKGGEFKPETLFLDYTGI